MDLVRNVQDPAAASKLLVDHALARFSTDNLSCMIVRFDKEALVESQNNKNIGVEVDPASTTGKISEAEKIVGEVRKQIEEGGSAVGVSASNSGKGRDPNRPDQEPDDSVSFTPTTLDGSLEEEPSEIDDAAEPSSDKPSEEPAEAKS